MKTVLKDSTLCTGCGACAASCSTHAIAMKPDEEGFLFPNIDGDACIHCGACERICPVNPEHPKDLLHGEPLAVYAAWNRDEEIRRQSSSGGVFTALAEQVLEEGGAVVGAAFDEEFRVRHVMVETKEDLARLRGSKYVQSEVSLKLYAKVRGELRKGRKVLFSGTPCQVAGMRRLLKQQDGILYVDILCHGVPSPLLWQKYLDSLPDSKGIVDVSFRDKTFGWKNFSLSVKYIAGKKITEQLWKNKYLQAFLRDMALRHACYCCPFARTERVGDVTLADFWGIEKCHPEYDDDKGTSLVFASSEKGIRALGDCAEITTHQVQKSDALAGNPILRGPSHHPSERKEFYKTINDGDFGRMVRRYKLGRPSFLHRIAHKSKCLIKRIIGDEK